ncbi:MAG: polysaccharide deacetylase [Nocardioides sp.]|jgi:peptidoglycan/xylan/chitin deacetylase (PgdA/CDA1 family)|nr:polysaccharide deacetylase [Nocardioides sp.]
MRLALAALVTTLFALPAAAPASGADPRQRTPCSRGLVALTFDDGPSATVTPRLVRVLKRLDVPATFFMVGSRIASAPDAARLVARSGFAIGNHTWAHTDLTTQSRAEIRDALRDTRREMRRVGITPTDLVRPPYGSVDARVRRVLAHDGYVPVLWTVDSRDWVAGRGPGAIVATVLSEVRPHPTDPAADIVLQHDGVTNSPATVRALPQEVARLRRLGYCLAALDTLGHPAPPVPVASVTATRTVLEGHSARVTVRLDRPTSLRTSVVVWTQDVATTRGDHAWSRRQVRFRVGETRARLTLPVPRDGLDEDREEVALGLDAGHGIRPSGRQALLTIVDRDGPPDVTVTGGSVTRSATVDVAAPVVVRLSRASGRDVRVHVRTRRGSAGAGDVRTFDGWMVVPAGARSTEVPVAVPPGPVTEPTETFAVQVRAARHAVVAEAEATVTVRPATSPPAAPRLVLPRASWS